MTDKETIHDLLDLVLQHEPEKLGLRLGDGGWVNMCDLLNALHEHNVPLTVSELYRAIAASDKQRLTLSEDGQYIRASRGHSIVADMPHLAQRPPEILHVGATTQCLGDIREHGLLKTKDLGVYLAHNIFLVCDGAHLGDAVILVVLAGDMYRAGHDFRRFTNNVWLVSDVPPHFIDFDAKPWPHLVTQLLKRHTRRETFEILLSLITQQNERADQVYLEYALIAAGLHRNSSEMLSKLHSDIGNNIFADLADYVPALLDVSRKSPFQRIRAIAVNSLPNLDTVSAQFGAPSTLPDVAARTIYVAKLGDRSIFTALLEELRAQATVLQKSFFIMIPPLTLTYLVDQHGPCIEIGPGGRDEGHRLAMTAQELFDSLRVPPELPSEQQVQRFKAIIGNLTKRKPY